VDHAALFSEERGRFLPGEMARGPWTPDALHGGPVAALVARAAEQLAPQSVLLSRLTLELMRPVPMAPLEVRAGVERPGRKVQVIGVSVFCDEAEVARARALCIRTLDALSPEARGLPDAATVTKLAGGDPAPPPGPDDGHWSRPISHGYSGFHNGGTDIRFVGGEFGTRGPATVWVRLTGPVVDGEEPSPAQRAAAAADFGNGFSSVLDFERFTFINPDLTVALLRPPVGEWICLRASTRLGSPGTGLARCELRDVEGPVGHAVQCLVVEARLRRD
jgi:hypothetical protein